MGKLRLNVHRKNEKRKKYGFFPVRIPLNDAISVLKVSLPLDLLSFEVSVPLSAFSKHQRGLCQVYSPGLQPLEYFLMVCLMSEVLISVTKMQT